MVLRGRVQLPNMFVPKTPFKAVELAKGCRWSLSFSSAMLRKVAVHITNRALKFHPRKTGVVDNSWPPVLTMRVVSRWTNERFSGKLTKLLTHQLKTKTVNGVMRTSIMISACLSGGYNCSHMASKSVAESTSRSIVRLPNPRTRAPAKQA